MVWIKVIIIIIIIIITLTIIIIKKNNNNNNNEFVVFGVNKCSEWRAVTYYVHKSCSLYIVCRTC